MKTSFPSDIIIISSVYIHIIRRIVSKPLRNIAVFIYSEMLTDLTGSSALTGRRFAVNAASGTVYHLEPGGNGEQLLLPVG